MAGLERLRAAPSGGRKSALLKPTREGDCMRRIWIGSVVAAVPLAIVCSGAMCDSYALASRMGHTVRSIVPPATPAARRLPAQGHPRCRLTGGFQGVTELGPGRGWYADHDHRQRVRRRVTRLVIGQGNGPDATAIAATEVSVVSSTQITATTGGGAQPGTWNLWVIPPNGIASEAVTGATFTYTATATNSLVVTKLGSSTGTGEDPGPHLAHGCSTSFSTAPMASSPSTARPRTTI